MKTFLVILAVSVSLLPITVTPQIKSPPTVVLIKGGSVELNYDESIYPKDSKEPRRHGNANQKITRVVITGDIAYDSNDHPNGIICNIEISCR